MEFLEILKQFIFAGFGSVGFAIFFGIPSSAILQSGFISGLGWVVYYISSTYYNSVLTGAFLGALTVGFIGEMFARYYKKPATVYIIPGIIPLVPGSGMYYTMLHLVEKDLQLATAKGIETFFVTAAISIGIILSTSLSESIKRAKVDTALKIK